MKSPLKWLGGKSRLAPEIVKRIPPHQAYCEVFAGAGWVFFHKPQSRIEVLNDINGDLISFYRILQNHLEEFCRQFKWLLSSREFFDNFKKQQEAGGLTDIQRAVRFYYLQRHAFGGKVTGQTFGVSKESPPPVNLVRLETELSEVHFRLSGVTIENLSWEKFIPKYDSPSMFFYLDPPYYGTEHFYGRNCFKREDFLKMNMALQSVQGKFLLSLNDCPEVRKIFSSFFIEATSTMYSCAREGNEKVKEVFITNYEKQPEGLLGLCG